MGTPQPTYLPRTIASDRADGAEPSIAQHERKIAHVAAHLVAVAHGPRAARAVMVAGRFRWNQRMGGGRTPPRPPWSWGSRQIKMRQQHTPARELTGSTS